ncbi:hypothetical protein [Chlorogloea sp. CCALA 695]|uniref:hypothetical protein n=1 Tax=Chlorogloea sp. CCALA 695 TaxID=2107693 RepID=UPI000D063A12|nr:hypothetical protein [Chlorogloea sp. CCALA 695]PSB31345.1 hypothetical protein C7B70_13510 [Chlorogloea sp. CCALA 695]
MVTQLIATARIHWLDSAHGGRLVLPSDPIYATTGRFAEREDELFSVIVRFSLMQSVDRQLSPDLSGFLQSKQGEDEPQRLNLDEAKIGFFAPELVKNKLYPGVKLLLTEGPQVVAECEIKKVFQTDLTAITNNTQRRG